MVLAQCVLHKVLWLVESVERQLPDRVLNVQPLVLGDVFEGTPSQSNVTCKGY